MPPPPLLVSARSAATRHRRLAAGISTVTCGTSVLRGANSSRSRFTSGSSPAASSASSRCGQHAFDAVAGGHLEQRDDGLASLSLRQLQVELLPRPAVRLAREQRVAEHQPLERLGLALERVDEVPVVDHPAAPVDAAIACRARA